MLSKILDCTLRDGGYYTQWDFDKELVNVYFKSFDELPVEYLEIGYRSKPMGGYLGEYFYCPEYVLHAAKENSAKKLVIILNEKDVKAGDAKELLSPCIGYITMVRLAIDPANFKRALVLAEEVKKLGFEVGFNVMYMSNWKQYADFLDLIPEVGGIANYFYMVDSFGGVYPEDVKNTYELVKSKTDVKIGFHGHNNLELGLINTLTALDCGADMVDATVTGMGRGAGNLKTELLLTALNSRSGLDVNFNALGLVTDAFVSLQQRYEWGTNLPYMVSGANSLPQKDVMEWVTKRFYSFNSIIRALQNQKEAKKDNQKLPEFESSQKFKNALIVGGGPSANSHSSAIKEFLNKNPDTAIIYASSRNAKYFQNLKNTQYFCLIGSEGQRLESVLSELTGFTADCILPPFPRKMGTYIPQQLEGKTHELVSFSKEVIAEDSPTILAFELAKKMHVQNVYIVGYDGYSDELMGEKEKALFAENDEVFDNYISDFDKLESLTPTKYKNLDVHSVYSLLVE
ncbi:hypothetical protein [Marivirga harenae]|uniref:hypothetical protein n=1 Tax=Marivirga harenae TaxID=2010992 RepID=UPI0026DFCF05|nr:hypothetical protein [Marivirga harenae]WKV11367.1 hypothetical protein Q3Y49_14255 [Marivirga harenae]